MALTKGYLLQPQGMSTVERDMLTVAGADNGRLIFNETTSTLQLWDGVSWVDVASGTISVAAVNITGQLTDAQIAGMAASKLTGQVTDAQIADVAAAKITGQVGDTQISNVSASKLLGDIDGGVY